MRSTEPIDVPPYFWTMSAILDFVWSRLAPLLQFLLDPHVHPFERGRGVGWVRAAGLRHVGLAAALAADLRRGHVHELAGFHFRDEVIGHARDQRNLFTVRRAEQDDRGAELGLQL